MTASFARQIGGAFHMTSDPGTGTTATFSLPLAGEHAPLPTPEDAAAADLTGLRLLVTEDDPQFGDILADALALMGADVARARSGDEALALLTEGGRPFDILMTDIILPGDLNGFVLAARAVELRPDLRVIYVSGYAESVPQDQRQVPGIFLRKPVGVAALTHAVRLVMRPH